MADHLRTLMDALPVPEQAEVVAFMVAGDEADVALGAVFPPPLDVMPDAS